MAQPTQFILKYTGAFKATAMTQYLGSAFAVENIMQMKTSGVRASVNGSPLFDVSFDDMTFVDTTATYSFDKDCIIATGTMVEVV